MVEIVSRQLTRNPRFGQRIHESAHATTQVDGDAVNHVERSEARDKPCDPLVGCIHCDPNDTLSIYPRTQDKRLP